MVSESPKHKLNVGWLGIGCCSNIQLVFTSEYAFQLSLTDISARIPRVKKTDQSSTFRVILIIREADLNLFPEKSMITF